MSPPFIRVLIADDTFVHTQLLAEALRRDQQLEVSIATSANDVIQGFKHHSVDVMVISANLDDEPMRGCVVLREMRAIKSNIRAIMMLDSSKQEIILQAFRSGARGLFSRHESVETLGKCIRSVHQGQIWANSQQMSYAVEALASMPELRTITSNGVSLLSKRELEVVRSLAEGMTNREIAERLNLSQHTVKNYLFRVYEKTGVSNRLELLFMVLGQEAPVTTPALAKAPTTLGAAGLSSESD